jgi:lipid-A-disaccharide synthase
MLPVFLAGAERFQQRCAESPVFLVPCASTIDESDLLEHGIRDFESRLDIRIISRDHYSLMAACDAAVVTSGTVTLEVMLLDTPAVVAYKVTPMTYLVGKLLIRNISYFSLVNLIADREVLPELLQDEVNGERVAVELYRLVFDAKARETIAQGYKTVRAELGEPGASKRAAALALSLLRPN